jgi:hypothetical protein
VEAMIVRVLVVIAKMVTSLVVSAKTATVIVETARKVPKDVLIVLVVSSLMLHQNFHSVQRQNVFAHSA